ncbi:PAS domain S-box-containing protein [Caloranaerobacter azorensis DSM 13643]|uniref:HTH-type transcriptional regulatory protein TyrR n=1 Tax=Caloranaerobacter azorensis DSM 13643 TaxID=1121264 RepID=A0A1M5TM39_9FIRM|nr:sigma 54-interacting transcriptional regulator [Caloranaerobacter azorensis]SHH51710.1 PAS domain S-box-containing protein [Caloranaerobacter azorensis DSM 13643]
MQDIISISQNKCKQCYSCVRNCPAKAVQIESGQAKIIHSRCINCGKCIKSCPQEAKIVLDSKGKTLNILKENDTVIACIAPSFVVSFHKYNYKKIIGALKEVGFSEVWEVAVGAEYVIEAISQYIKNKENNLFLSSPCPAFISLIEKHYPEMIKYLLPFVSPMIATGKIIREMHKGKDVKIVFIGPCVAKKCEALEPQFNGIIDSVLTFDELKDIFKIKGVNIEKAKEMDFDSIYCDEGKLFPLSGGLLRNLKSLYNLNESEYVVIDNDKDCIELINAIKDGKFKGKFVDVLMCRGCIDGPKIDSSLNYYERINKIYEYKNSTKKINKHKVKLRLDFTRHYSNKRSILPYPTESEIQRVLNMTNKFTKEDELNCGACGYNTCREKAIAVLQGIAEVDMCLPYLISKKSKLVEQLSETLKETKNLKDELEAVIESSYDGLVVTDGNGRILKTNSAWRKMVGYKTKKEESVKDMENKNIIFPSATLLVLKEKRRISFIQYAHNDKEYLATATPIFDNDSSVKMVVTNIRDIDELNRLREQIEETRKLQKYHKETKRIKYKDYYNENIVVNSIEFGEVLGLASSVAKVDSTVLILGESGVGKEIVANFIHNLSIRKDKPFIKINCGAIPENLIESELFGYETGAFTGAKKKGKPGLIELADEGTLFLDEIGELPLNLQVKLLRVIQERKIMRIGGIKEKYVDVRIIAATNRDLYKMVQRGEFRADLYYRLNVVPIEIPPLRKRKTDILPLCYHFLDIFNSKYRCNKRLSKSVEKILEDYNWPGNVRELENLIERVVVTTPGDIIDVKDLPMFLLENTNDGSKKIDIEGIMPLREAVELVEKKLIKRAYKQCKSTYEMAKVLGVNQSTVVRKIQKYIKSNALKHD